MKNRIVKVAKELNVGIRVMVDFLAANGFTVEPKPTSQLTDEMYSLLIKKFKNASTIKDDSVQGNIEAQVIDYENTMDDEVDDETEIQQSTIDNYNRQPNSIAQNNEIITTNTNQDLIDTNYLNLRKIGIFILDHIRLEKGIGVKEESIGYAKGRLNDNEFSRWILRHPKSNNFVFVRDVHGNPIGTVSTGRDTLYTSSNCVFRDSELGLNLKKGVGSRFYRAPRGDISLYVDTYSQYTGVDDFGGDARNGMIQVEGQEKDFTFSSLYQKLEELRILKDKHDELEALIHDNEDDLSEEAKKLVAELAQNEAEINELKSRITKYIAQEVALRDNPHLDEYQEEIKRSKVFDGPLIINGGPGTGKTTSLIQRITYLTSVTIEEKTGELSPEKSEMLFNQRKSWIFFSPTDLLRDYLANAMIAEGLDADKSRVRTWDNHRTVLLRQAGLINTETKKPFVIKNGKSYFHPSADIYVTVKRLFLKHIMDAQKDKVAKIHQEDIIKKLQTPIDVIAAENKRKELYREVTKMQDASKYALKLDKHSDWFTFYKNFRNSFLEFFNALNKDIRDQLNDDAARLQINIEKNAELYEWIKKWVISDTRNTNVDPDTDDEDYDAEDNINGLNPNETIDLRRIINGKLKGMLRSLAIRSIDATNNKLSDKNKVLYEKISSLVKEEKLPHLGIQLYFKKYFELLGRGPEINYLNEIPKHYKAFRRIKLKDNPRVLTDIGIKECNDAISKDSINHQEADLILCIIFDICRAIFETDKKYYNESDHLYLTAYKENAKAVVAIDEATDFSIWELAVMSTLSHPLFNSVTLSGDLMQRMTTKGIHSWSDYQKIYPDAEVQDLVIAYRQTAKLLKIASSIYENILEVPAKFRPYHDEDDRDPEPLVFIGDDEEEKLSWVVARIMEIHHLYGTSFPTVAIFVKNDTEVLRISNLLKDYSELEEVGIGVSACVQGQILGNQEHIRVFSIEYIKGLEFGAVFFLDLDQLSDGEQELINKFIYVGLSRANLFSGVTFMDDYPESISYLEPIFKEGNWKVNR